MSLQRVTPELKAKALACETVDELVELATEEGYELSDEQLDSIAGGKNRADLRITTTSYALHANPMCRGRLKIPRLWIARIAIPSLSSWGSALLRVACKGEAACKRAGRAVRVVPPCQKTTTSRSTRPSRSAGYSWYGYTRSTMPPLGEVFRAGYALACLVDKKRSLRDIHG